MLVFKIPFLVCLVTGGTDKEVDLEQYFLTKTPLHCTTQFCDYGKAEGAKEYAEQQVGHALELHVRIRTWDFSGIFSTISVYILTPIPTFYPSDLLVAILHLLFMLPCLFNQDQ